MNRVLKVILVLVVILIMVGLFVGVSYFNMLDKLGISLGHRGFVDIGDVPEWVSDYNRLLLDELGMALESFNEGESYYSELLKKDFRQNVPKMRLFGYEHEDDLELPDELKEIDEELNRKLAEFATIDSGNDELEAEIESLEREYDELYGEYIDEIDKNRDKNEILTDKILSTIYLGSIRTDVTVDRFVREYGLYLQEEDIDYESDDFGEDIVNNMLIMLGPDEVYNHLQYSANDLENIENDLSFICELLDKDCEIEYDEDLEREIYKVK